MMSKKVFLPFFLVVCILTGIFLFLQPRYAVPMLMYHYIEENGKYSSLSVSPESFRRQVEFLHRNKYNVISLAEFVSAAYNKEKLPRKSVVITFDDGYEDNFTCAYPVLRAYHIPATIFVIVNSIGEKGYLSYAQIKEMLDSGIIDIGSHTLEGDYLPGKSREHIEREIGLSKKILEARLNRKIDFLCYPIGGFTPQMQDIVRKNGYIAACTTNRGIKKTCFNDDIFALKRIKIKDSSNPLVLWAKLSGYYNLFRKVKSFH
ncbi:MAG: polysaccharide deacetylase family protein [Candidatus Omnitrophota bacterium]